MGALASLWLKLPPGAPGPARLAALAGAYFSETVAARGVGSAWGTLIQDAAAETGLDPALLQAVIAAESGWDPSAVSADGTSWGLMQLNVRAHGLSEAEALEPAWAIPFGARLLAAQLARRPSLTLALAAYNAGTSRTDADLTARVTRDTLGVGSYVETVRAYLDWYQTAAPPRGRWPTGEVLRERWATEGQDLLAPEEPEGAAAAGAETGTALEGPPAWLWGALAGVGALVLVLVATRGHWGALVR